MAYGMIFSKTYAESECEEPDITNYKPCSQEDIRFVVGSEFSFDSKRICVEAFDFERRAYALRNVNGKKIEWVSNTKLQESFKSKGLPTKITIPLCHS